MTVKELKEILELLIKEGKEDYSVYVDLYSDEYVLYVYDEKRKCIYNDR